jgi:hypothetical protein
VFVSGGGQASWGVADDGVQVVGAVAAGERAGAKLARLLE